ncbi:MAG: hypothetical protein KGI66_02335 [Patescibacteria group bacterium]|nr:hypothetical protein [Patescibacteria group bacterium]
MSNVVVQVGPIEDLDAGKAGGRKLLRAVIGGTLGNSDVPVLSAWAEGLNSSVNSVAGGKKQSVCVLIDIRRMETYSDPQVITILAELMKKDDPFVYKTATYGGTALHQMIEGVIRGMAGRSNLMNFPTESEALRWLRE